MSELTKRVVKKIAVGTYYWFVGLGIVAAYLAALVRWPGWVAGITIAVVLSVVGYFNLMNLIDDERVKLDRERNNG